MQFLALAQGQFCYFFKSNVFFVLSLRAKTENAPRRRAQGAPSFGCTKIHPVRLPKQTPDRRSVQMVSPFDQKKWREQPPFFSSRWSSPSAPKCAKPASTYFFEPQKNMLRSLQHVKTKKRAKVIFEWRK